MTYNFFQHRLFVQCIPVFNYLIVLFLIFAGGVWGGVGLWERDFQLSVIRISLAHAL